MGQRTQLVIKAMEKITGYNGKKDEIKIYSGSYHNQWGFAKMQLKDVINFLNTYIKYREFEMPKQLHRAFLEEPEYQCRNVSVEGAKEYFNHYADNNDGGVYLEVYIEKGIIQKGALVLFSDPEAMYKEGVNENPEAEPYLTLAQYIRMNPRYYDKQFYKMFIETLKYHNIKIATSEKDLL